MNDTEKEALKKILQDEFNRRRRTDLYPHRRFYNYYKKDGSKSWQHDLDDLLGDPEVEEVYVMAANSCGKSFKISLLIAQIINNDHPFCKNFNEPIHIHVIVKDHGVQKNTIQKELEKITDFEISGIDGAYSKAKYKINVHGGVIKEIIHLENKNRVTFSSSEKGAVGLVGVRPHLLLSDEPFSESIFNELVVRTTTKNSKFCMLATVVESEHAWVALRANQLLESPIKSKRVITAKMIDNPHVPIEKIENLKKTFGEESPQYRVRVLGCIEMISGLVYDGIENCLVDDLYVPDIYRDATVEEQERHFVWAESHDYGIGAQDPTLIGFFQIWDSGEIVMADEVCLYEKTCVDWADAIIKKRYELDMPIQTEGYPPAPSLDVWYELNGVRVDDPMFNQITNYNAVRKGTGYEIRVPNICVGDKQYLARKVSMGGSSRLKSYLAERKIYVSPSKGDRIETSLPICQDLVRQRIFKIKRKCRYSYNFFRSFVAKYNPDTGKINYDSPNCHSSDIFRYLVERVGNGNIYIKSIISEREFLRTQHHLDKVERLRDVYGSRGV